MAIDDKWRVISCVCYAGLRMGRDEPTECTDCNGSARIFIRPSGHLFAWPGGPAVGRTSPQEYERAEVYRLEGMGVQDG